MAIYKIAGHLFSMNPRYGLLKRRSEKYLYTGDTEGREITDIDISPENFEKKLAEYPYISPTECEYIFYGVKFAHKMLAKEGFVLHSSAVAYDGYAYLFSADSGTGKSTHTSFWQECFGEENAVIINDDKPVLNKIDGVYYASGTPFSGKSDLNADITVPVKALCFIYRSPVSEIRRLEPKEAFDLLFRQTLSGKSERMAVLYLERIDDFLKNVPVYSFGVPYSKDAAEFAYKYFNKQ